MAKKKPEAVEPITGWILLGREELDGGRRGPWYICWGETFRTKRLAMQFTKDNHWIGPYRAVRGQIAVMSREREG